MSIQTGQAQERKLNNLRAIFSMYVPAAAPVQQIQPRPPPKKDNPFNKFEEDKDDSMQIADVPLAEALFAQPNLGKQGSTGHIQADNMDAFLSAHEKERAATIYQQM